MVCSKNSSLSKINLISFWVIKDKRQGNKKSGEWVGQKFKNGGGGGGGGAKQYRGGDFYKLGVLGTLCQLWCLF